MTTGYIAHFYPPEDAAVFFQPGSIVQVMAPVFKTMAEAANQIGEEISDITEAGLPVCAYILEVESVDGGFRILDTIEIEDDETDEDDEDYDEDDDEDYAFRVNNPAGGGLYKPKIDTSTENLASRGGGAGGGGAAGGGAAGGGAAGNKPAGPQAPAWGDRVGGVKGSGRSRVVEMGELKKITTGSPESLKTADAAQKYGGFMASKAPEGVSPRLITGAFNKAAKSPAKNQIIEQKAEARKVGAEQAGQVAVEDVRQGDLLRAVNDSDKKIRELTKALKESKDGPESVDITRQIAIENKRWEILHILLTYCPACTPELAQQQEAFREQFLSKMTPEDSRALRSTYIAAQVKKEKAAQGQAAQGSAESSTPPPPPPQEESEQKAPKFGKATQEDADSLRSSAEAVASAQGSAAKRDALLALVEGLQSITDKAELYFDELKAGEKDLLELEGEIRQELAKVKMPGNKTLHKELFGINFGDYNKKAKGAAKRASRPAQEETPQGETPREESSQAAEEPSSEGSLFDQFME